MRKAVQLCAVLGALAFLPDRAAEASTHSGGGWTVQTGETVGAGLTAVHVQAGWPGVSATLLYGYSPTVDLGGIFTFNYGAEGDVNLVHPGLKLQGYGKANLVNDPKYNLGVWFAPGGLVYFFGGPNGTIGGIALATGLVFGLPVAPNVNVSFNFDVPLFIYFVSGYSGVGIPLMFGGGVEYFLEKNMALTFNLRAGPIIYTASGGGTDFGLNALFGLAFKL